MKTKIHSQQPGSFEGRMQAVSLRGGHALITLRDELSGASLECRIREHDLFRAMTALGQRVILYGQIQYLPNGKPVRATAERLLRLSDSAFLPTVDEVRGMLR